MLYIIHICLCIIYSWNWLLYYIISVIFFKVLLNLLGCFILNYFKWYPCILMQFLSMYCSLQTFEEHQSKFNAFKTYIYYYKLF